MVAAPLWFIASAIFFLASTLHVSINRLAAAVEKRNELRKEGK